MTKDLTKGNPIKLILLFALPLLVGNIFQQLYSMADTLIVGRTIGAQALAAVGCTGSLSFLILGFAMGFTGGLSIVTSQRFGAGDEDGVRRSVATGIISCGGLTLLLTAVSVPMTRPILQAIQTPPELIDDAQRYIIIIFWGIFALMLFNFLSNIIRALGDSRTPLVFLAITCLLNIVLDFAFILYFNMGVMGAAVATVVSQLISGLLCVWYIVKKLPILHLHKDSWKIDWRELWAHLRIGLPMGFQFSIIAVGSVAVQYALNKLGWTAVAAFTAAQKIDAIATMPLMSFGSTMATYTAQNYGAREFDRIRKGVKQCSLLSVGLSIVMAIVIIAAGRWFTAAFVGAGETEVISLAQIYLVTNGVPYFILALLFVYRNTLQGVGNSFIPMVAGVMELIMRVAAALILAEFMGYTGVCLSNPLAWLGACIPLSIAYFRTAKRLI